MDEIRKQYEAHAQKAYPATAHVDGAELELIDSTIAGCVASFLGSSSGLEQHDVNALKKSLSELQDNQDVIPEGAKSYFAELQALGEKVLERADDRRT